MGIPFLDDLLCYLDKIWLVLNLPQYCVQSTTFVKQLGLRPRESHSSLCMLCTTLGGRRLLKIEALCVVITALDILLTNVKAKQA